MDPAVAQQGACRSHQGTVLDAGTKITATSYGCMPGNRCNQQRMFRKHLISLFVLFLFLFLYCHLSYDYYCTYYCRNRRRGPHVTTEPAPHNQNHQIRRTKPQQCRTATAAIGWNSAARRPSLASQCRTARATRAAAATSRCTCWSLFRVQG